MRLHPTLGVNPRLTICPRCGGDGEDLLLLGSANYYDTCPECGARVYGGLGEDKSCPSCRATGLTYGVTRTQLKEGEKVPGALCKSCRAEEAEFRRIVEDGGVYVRYTCCGKCGVIKNGTEAAKRLRDVAADGKYRDPIDGKYPAFGVELDESNCPFCNVV